MLVDGNLNSLNEAPNNNKKRKEIVDVEQKKKTQNRTTTRLRIRRIASNIVMCCYDNIVRIYDSSVQFHLHFGFRFSIEFLYLKKCMNWLLFIRFLAFLLVTFCL